MCLLGQTFNPHILPFKSLTNVRLIFGSITWVNGSADRGLFQAKERAEGYITRYDALYDAQDRA